MTRHLACHLPSLKNTYLCLSNWPFCVCNAQRFVMQAAQSKTHFNTLFWNENNTALVSNSASAYKLLRVCVSRWIVIGSRPTPPLSLQPLKDWWFSWMTFTVINTFCSSRSMRECVCRLRESYWTRVNERDQSDIQKSLGGKLAK